MCILFRHLGCRAVRGVDDSGLQEACSVWAVLRTSVMTHICQALSTSTCAQDCDRADMLDVDYLGSLLQGHAARDCAVAVALLLQADGPARVRVLLNWVKISALAAGSRSRMAASCAARTECIVYL